MPKSFESALLLCSGAILLSVQSQQATRRHEVELSPVVCSVVVQDLVFRKIQRGQDPYLFCGPLL